jgi:hypothetical protein
MHIYLLMVKGLTDDLDTLHVKLANINYSGDQLYRYYRFEVLIILYLCSLPTYSSKCTYHGGLFLYLLWMSLLRILYYLYEL